MLAYVYFDVRWRLNLLNAGVEVAVCPFRFCFSLFVFVLVVMLVVMLFLSGSSCRLFAFSLYFDIIASRINAEAAMGSVLH
jgi:hypothetical protein